MHPSTAEQIASMHNRELLGSARQRRLVPARPRGLRAIGRLLIALSRRKRGLRHRAGEPGPGPVQPICTFVPGPIWCRMPRVWSSNKHKCYCCGVRFDIYIRVTDLGPHGTAAQLGDPGDGPKLWWSACSARHDGVNGGAPDAVTCTITNWTNTSITLASFDFSTLENEAADHSSPPTTRPPKGIKTGLLDTYAIQVWNPENGTGPAVAIAYWRLPPA